jgi:hypothetical protein
VRATSATSGAPGASARPSPPSNRRCASTSCRSSLTRRYIGTLSALFNYAKAPQRRWAAANPCDGVELPGVPESEDIRFLDEAEWEAVLRHVQPGDYAAIDRPLYLTAIWPGCGTAS